MKNYEVDDGPQTREEWIENNKAVMEAEHATPAEVFFNQIETRLALDPGLRNRADERLGAAYIACLAQYEAQGEEKVWAPLTVRHLIVHEGVTREEAEVIVEMARQEYTEYEPNTLMRPDRNRLGIHWLWRHTWGLYEKYQDEPTRRLFNLLDWLHDRLDY